MTNKQRSLLLLVCEMLALALVFVFIMTCGSSAYVKEFFDKIEYPRDYVEYVRKYSYKYGVDENMIFAIIKAESGFDKDAESRVGAIGLMQIMPSTYEGDLKGALGFDNDDKDIYKDTFTALKDPQTNIICGTYYFSHWHKYYEDNVSALAAYNAGPGTVERWLSDKSLINAEGKLDPEKIPYKETKKYVRRVLSYYEHYKAIYGDNKADAEGSISRAEALEYAKKYGAKFKVDYNFIMAVIETESSFRYAVVSSSGAIGLMQMKSSTYFVDVAANLNLPQGADELFEPEFNVMCGAYYLHWLDYRVDGINTIAAAYHGGIGTVRGWLADESISPGGVLDPEKIPDAATKRYVEKIRGFYEKSVELDGPDETYRFSF